MEVKVEGKIIVSRENNTNRMSKSSLAGWMQSNRKGKRKPMQLKRETGQGHAEPHGPKRGSNFTVGLTVKF